MIQKQRHEFNVGPFTHRYHPVRWNAERTVYGPGEEMQEAQTTIETVLSTYEPQPGLLSKDSDGKWYEGSLKLRFDLNGDGTKRGGYASETLLTDVPGHGGSYDELHKMMAEAFPDRSVSLKVTVHTVHSQEKDISLLADRIYESLALNAAQEALEKAKSCYGGN